jgi:uncharacterized protein YheU (UPF0270 family)
MERLARDKISAKQRLASLKEELSRGTAGINWDALEDMATKKVDARRNDNKEHRHHQQTLTPGGAVVKWSQISSNNKCRSAVGDDEHDSNTSTASGMYVEINVLNTENKP